jgi:acetyltransferase-like isoleucine patch superfamily enzyme
MDPRQFCQSAKENAMTTIAQKKTHGAVTGSGSALQRYQQTIVGDRSGTRLLYFEWCQWLGLVPGAAGLLLRKVFWPRLFGSCGKGTVFGAGVILRHPHRIVLGERVVVSDGCILDARNEALQEVLVIGDDTMLSNQVQLSCKDGFLRIGARAGVGVQTIMQSVHGSPIEVGDDVLIGPGCYIGGGGNYRTERLDIPMAKQGLRDDPGVVLAGDNWLGARVSVLSGVTMGQGSIAATGAVVNRSVPEYAVVGGVPAKVLKSRLPAEAPRVQAAKVTPL